jgi:hypothetical protein
MPVMVAMHYLHLSRKLFVTLQVLPVSESYILGFIVSCKLHGVSYVFVGGLLYVCQLIIYLLGASTP